MKKGFVLVETMIVSLFVLISIVMLYRGFSVVITKASNRNNYDNIVDVYKLKTMLNKRGLTSSIFSNNIQEISVDKNIEDFLYSNDLGKLYALKSNYDLSSITNNTSLNNTLIDYIKTLSRLKNYFIYEYIKDETYHYVSLEAGE